MSIQFQFILFQLVLLKKLNRTKNIICVVMQQEMYRDVKFHGCLTNSRKIKLSWHPSLYRGSYFKLFFYNRLPTLRYFSFQDILTFMNYIFVTFLILAITLLHSRWYIYIFIYILQCFNGIKDIHWYKLFLLFYFKKLYSYEISTRLSSSWIIYKKYNYKYGDLLDLLANTNAF